jgi:hypothetical protein
MAGFVRTISAALGVDKPGKWREIKRNYLTSRD